MAKQSPLCETEIASPGKGRRVRNDMLLQYFFVQILPLRIQTVYQINLLFP
jgi:hypothetical protein